jgi:hypothetical protein
LRNGRRTEAQSLVRSIEAAFTGASPRPEVHELPIDALLDLARGERASGDAGEAVRLGEVAAAWLVGRPHRRANETVA